MCQPLANTRGVMNTQGGEYDMYHEYNLYYKATTQLFIHEYI